MYYGKNDFIYYLFIMLPIFLLMFLIDIRMRRIYSKYSNIKNSRGITGADAARRILEQNGIRNVQIEIVRGSLTDHFDPRTNTLRLSEKNYNESSIAAVGVAAHEAGHAIQYAKRYAPVKLRTAMVPAIKFSSWLYAPLIVLGFLSRMPIMFDIVFGILLLMTIFQLVTLPVEFNASRRAISVIESNGILSSSELSGVKKVLWAAAMTYVVAFLLSLAQLLRMFLSSKDNDRK